MTTTTRDNIASRVARLLGAITKPRHTPQDLYEAADAGASLLADALTDVNRIADAIETISVDGIGNIIQGIKLSEADRAAVIRDRERRSINPDSVAAGDDYEPVWNDEPGDANEPLEKQTERLGAFILENFPGEPSQNQGAIDTAIRLLTKSDGKAISGYNPGPEGGTVPGSAEDFAAFLTTRPDVIKVGANETVYAVFNAVKEYRKRLLDRGIKTA